MIFLNGWILPIGGFASGRVWACSLLSKLDFFLNSLETGVGQDEHPTFVFMLYSVLYRVIRGVCGRSLLVSGRQKQFLVVSY